MLSPRAEALALAQEDRRVPLSVWAGCVHDAAAVLNRMQLQDWGVSVAAHAATLLVPRPSLPAQASGLQIALQGLDGPSSAAVAEARTSLALVTHLALRGDLGSDQRILLSTVQRGLVGHTGVAEARPLRGALEGWHTALLELDPLVLGQMPYPSAIAGIQATLLEVTMAEFGRFTEHEAYAALGSDEFQDALGRARDAWRTARTHWLTQPAPQTFVDRGSPTALSNLVDAMAQVEDAALARPADDRAGTLHTLLSVDPAGMTPARLLAGFGSRHVTGPLVQATTAVAALQIDLPLEVLDRHRGEKSRRPPAPAHTAPAHTPPRELAGWGSWVDQRIVPAHDLGADLRKAALAVVNDSDPLPVRVWAGYAHDAAAVLGRHGVTDHTVIVAASIAPLVAAGMDRDAQVAPLQRGLRSLEGPAPAVTREVRSALALVTHSALNNSTLTGRQRIIMQALERMLLQRDTDKEVRPFGAALSTWHTTVLKQSPEVLAHPRYAAAIAQTHSKLLDLGIAQLERVTWSAEASVTPEEVQHVLDEGLAAWRNARTYWLRQPAPAPATTLDGSSLSMAGRDLALSFGESDSSSRVTLGDLIATDFGGNRTIAHLLHDAHPGVSLAPVMDRAGALVTLVPVGQLTDRHAVPERVAPVRGPVAQGQNKADRSSSPSRDRPAVDQKGSAWSQRESSRSAEGIPEGAATSLTFDESVELARRRDAGVIAKAVLDGLPQATRLRHDASAEELQRMVRSGEEATARMVSSVIHLTRGSTLRAAVGQHDDAFQDGIMAALAAAHRWDPDLGVAWSTYAYQSIKYVHIHRYHKDKSLVPVDDLRVQAAADFADDAAARVDNDRLRKTLQPAIAALPERERVIVTMKLGIGTGAEQSFSQIAEQLDISKAHVRRLYNRGLDTLRQALATDVTVSAPQDVTADASNPLMYSSASDVDASARLSGVPGAVRASFPSKPQDAISSSAPDQPAAVSPCPRPSAAPGVTSNTEISR